MKVKLRGLGGIKSLLMAHGEKLGIAVVGACAAMLVYCSLLRDHLPENRQAADLVNEVETAKQQIGDFNWTKAIAEFPTDVRVAKPLEQRGDNLVRVETYQSDSWQRAWDPPVVPPTVLRTDPVLLEAQDLEAHGGSGLLAFVDPDVRRRKILEEQREAAERSRKQEKQLERDQEAQGQDRNRGGRGGAGAYGEEGYGGVIDPEHPKRRAVVGTVRPAGVPLQDYEKINTAHWAVVVAKVPIKEQLKLYRDAFDNARGSDPAADYPQYLGYMVERAEIHPGAENEELKWEKVQVYSGEKEVSGKNKPPVSQVPVVRLEDLYGKEDNPATTVNDETKGVVTNWASTMPEIVDPRYLEGGALAFPLPPLVGRDWGSEVTHSEIPLASDAVAVEEEAVKTEEKTEEAGETAEADLFSGGAAPGMGTGRQPMYGGGRGGYGGYGEGGGRGGYGGGYSAEMGGRGGYGGGMRGGYGGEEGYGGAYAGGRGGMTTPGVVDVPHWLLRFIDFSVQPGKKYKYRVRMAMLDPNQSYQTRFVGMESLDSAVISRIKKEKPGRKPGSTPFRWTEWSKPSRTVSIPLAGNVRVATVKPSPGQFNGEPRATLLVESFGTDDKGNAIQAAKEMDFRRGSVANMTENAEIIADQGRAIDPVPDFKFQTDVTVVDVLGGERLVRDEKRPARVLLMDPAGQLFVQSELDDSESVEMHRATFAKEPAGGAGGEYFRGGGEFGGRGGYGIEGGGRGGRQ